MKRDYYEILEVDRSADDETLKRAYRRLAMKYHPDRNPGDVEAEERFKEAAEAYEVLRNPEMRDRYDRYGHAGLKGAPVGGFSSFNDIFDAFQDIFSGGSLFGELFGGMRRGGRHGRHLKCDIRVGFLEMARGATKSVTLRRQEICATCRGEGARPGSRPAPCATCGGRGAVVQNQGLFSIQSVCPRCGGRGEIIEDPCPDCKGEGRQTIKREIQVRIPPGIEDGLTLRVPGEGEPGEGGGPRGDLLCTIRVKPHSVFRREGPVLMVEVPLPYTTAALGGTIEVPTLNGKESLKIPKGTQPGRLFTIKGKGLPFLEEPDKAGDLVVMVQVEVPSKLTKRQRELLRELAEIESRNVTPKRRRFFEKIRDLFQEN